MRFVKLKKNLLMAAIALGLATFVYYPVQGKEPTTVSITKLNSAQISQQLPEKFPRSAQSWR